MTRVGSFAAAAAALVAAVVLIPALAFGSRAGYVAAWPWLMFLFLAVGDQELPVRQEAAVVALLGAAGWWLSVAAIGWLVVLVRANRRGRL
jgi:hypothetical protein